MNPLIDGFVWCMLQVTLFAAVAAIAYRLVAGERAQRNVAFLAACFGVIAVLTFASVSTWPRWNLSYRFPPQMAHESPLQDSPVLTPALPGLANTEIDASAQESGPPTTIVQQPADPRPHRPRLLETHISNSWTWMQAAVVAAWIAAAIGAFRFVVGWAYVRRFRRRSQTIDDPATLQLFEALRVELGVPASVELRESSAIGVPATFGWRRPIVLLPSTWRDWSHDELRAVLAHELSHVAQRHFPLWIGSQLATIAHFYNPLVHWLGRRLRLEQELAADELAAHSFGNRQRYAAVLAGLAIGKPQPAAVVGLGLFMSRPLLMRRITMLRETEHRRPSRLVRVSATLLLATSAIAIAGLRATTTAATGPDEAPGDGSSAASQFEAVRELFGAKVLTEKAASTKTPGLSVERSDASSPASTLPRDTAPDTATNPNYVTALIHVSRHPFTIGSGGDRPLNSDAEWQVYCKTQLAILRSFIPLQAALRDPKIAGLDPIKSQPDPLRWLSEQLDAGFIYGSEIMYVRLNASLGERAELATIVDAVVRAYMDEVVNSDRSRQNIMRDALAQSFDKLSDVISTKTRESNSLAHDMGVAAPGTERDSRTELLVDEIAELRAARRQLEQKLTDLEANFQVTIASSKDRSDIEPMQEEFEIRSQLYQKQVAGISQAIEEKTEQLLRRGEESVELRVRHEELRQLQEIAREMAIQLERIDVEQSLPARLRVIQWAM